MALLDLFRVTTQTKVDDAQPQLLAKPLLQRLERDAYDDAELILARTSEQNRERIIYGLASTKNAIPLAGKWASRKPKSATAQLVLGACLIVSGWKVRGDRFAEDVDKRAWAPFLAALNSAEDPLRRATELDPTLAEPYAWLLHLALGEDRTEKELHTLFAEAVTRVPLHWPSHYKYFFSQMRKWGGSHQAMFDFARNSAKLAPVGHLIHTLIPGAYNELALAIVADEGIKKMRPTILQAKYAHEVSAALYRWTGASADNLSDQLLRLSDGFAAYGLNNFAVALYLTGAHDEARAVLSALNGEIESTPWAWIAEGPKEHVNPGFVYDRACRELGVELPT